MPKKKRKSAKPTAAQIEIAGQFNHYSFENPGKNFRRICAKAIWPGLVSAHGAREQGRKFEQECRTVFDKEREA